MERHGAPEDSRPATSSVDSDSSKLKEGKPLAAAATDPAMPVPVLSLLLRALMSRLLLPAARLARQHLLPLLRRLARRLGSQDMREALLGCLLFVLSQQRHSPDAGEVSRVALSERRERLTPQK